MSKTAERPTDVTDDFDLAQGPDWDFDPFGEDPAEELMAGNTGVYARHELDRRAESQWLRGQMSDWDDWDDWDEYFECH